MATQNPAPYNSVYSSAIAQGLPAALADGIARTAAAPGGEGWVAIRKALLAYRDALAVVGAEFAVQPTDNALRAAYTDGYGG